MNRRSSCYWCGRKIDKSSSSKECDCGWWDAMIKNGFQPEYTVPNGAELRLPPFSFLVDGIEKVGFWHLCNQNPESRTFVAGV